MENKVVFSRIYVDGLDEAPRGDALLLSDLPGLIPENYKVLLFISSQTE